MSRRLLRGVPRYGVDALRPYRPTILLAVVMSATVTAAIAQGTIEQEQACQQDAVRLCADAMPDESKIRACLIQNRPKLSLDCQTMMRNQRRRPGRS